MISLFYFKGDTSFYDKVEDCVKEFIGGGDDDDDEKLKEDFEDNKENRE